MLLAVTIELSGEMILGLLGLLAGFMTWMTSLGIKCGKILSEVRALSDGVKVLNGSHESQDKRIEKHEARLIRLESHAEHVDSRVEALESHATPEPGSGATRRKPH